MLNYPTRGLPGGRGLDGASLGAVTSIASILHWSDGQKQTSKNKNFFFPKPPGGNVAVQKLQKYKHQFRPDSQEVQS